MENYWKGDGIFDLNQENLSKLLNNSIPFIKIKNFFSNEECEKCVTLAQSHGFGQYEGITPEIKRIGCTVFEFDRSASEGYFICSEQESSKRNYIFAKSINPLAKLIDKLTNISKKNVSIAKSHSGDSYYAGLIRRIESGTELHIDFSPAEQKGWEICDVIKQLAWNFYLQVGEEGTGIITIYNRAWNIEDDQFKEGSYGFSQQVVEGFNFVQIMPERGDLILFNTRNYHTVSPSEGTRITVTSAIGELPSGELIFWS